MSPHESDRQRRLLARARAAFGDGVMLMRNGARVTLPGIREHECMIVRLKAFATGYDVVLTARSWAKLEALLTRTERIPATLP
jgi:hypothetical protein